MHELSIATSILNNVCRVASEKKAVSVKKIYLVVGSSSAIIKRSLIEAFSALELLDEYKLCADTELEIIECISESICLNCGCEFKHGFGAGQCPECKSDNVQIIKGTNIYIDKIEIVE